MDHKTPLFTPVLIAGCLIIIVSFAVRATFGVFQIPIAEEFGWLRAEFSLAIAIQNLAWGIGAADLRRHRREGGRPARHRPRRAASTSPGWC